MVWTFSQHMEGDFKICVPFGDNISEYVFEKVMHSSQHLMCMLQVED